VLTSAQKKVDAAVFATIKSVQDGTWQGGRNETFGLRQKGVGLGTISKKVPASDLAALKTVSSEIADGQIRQIPTRVP
jgi:basic membrane protein A and related proteins